MKQEQESIVPIGLTFRFVLFGLDCILGIETSGRETNRVFRDCLEDQFNSRSYVFFEGNDLVISGVVDAYEPESIRVRVTTNRKRSIDLGPILEMAEARARLISFFENEG